MKILDSNIIVYSFQPEYVHLRELVLDPNNYVSVISKIEVLGYHKLDNSMKLYFGSVF